MPDARRERTDWVELQANRTVRLELNNARGSVPAAGFEPATWRLEAVAPPARNHWVTRAPGRRRSVVGASRRSSRRSGGRRSSSRRRRGHCRGGAITTGDATWSTSRLVWTSDPGGCWPLGSAQEVNIMLNSSSPPRERRRTSDGGMPKAERKLLVKWLWLENPSSTAKAARSISRSATRPRAARRRS